MNTQTAFRLTASQSINMSRFMRRFGFVQFADHLEKFWNEANSRSDTFEVTVPDDLEDAFRDGLNHFGICGSEVK